MNDPREDISPKESKLIERKCKVKNKFGIHARPAALFVKTANKYLCEITVEKDGIQVSGKSIMGLLTLEGHYQAQLILTFNGEDAEAAAEALLELFEKKFFED